METQVQKTDNSQIIESLVINGDVSALTPEQKVIYYKAFCERVGLDPLAQPFKLLKLNGKQVLYCDRSGAQQLNKIHKVSHEIKSREIVSDCYVVTAQASTPDGRKTECIGAVPVLGLKGEALCNAMMKSETKAKRRATLDLLGLGMLDETEVETIPNAVPVEPIPTNAASVNDNAYNHKQLSTPEKPLISNGHFKKLCDRVRSGDLEAYEKGLATFSFEDAQARTLRSIYEQSKTAA